MNIRTWLITTITVGFLFQIPVLNAKTFKAERWETSNGAKVVFYQANEVAMVDINVAFAAGSAYDGKNFGLSSLTSDLLNKGNGAFNATQIAEKFADIGAQFESNVSRDMALVQLKTLNNEEALKQAVNTLNLVITKPTFRQEAFNHEKMLQLGDITQNKESPNAVANQVFYNKLYQQHPYAHAISGTEESVKAIQNYQVREFYKRYYVANNALIVIVGAIDSNKAHLIAEQVVSNLPKGTAAPAIPKAIALANTETVGISFPSSQTILRLGQVGIDHNVSDYFPLMIGNYILGGGSMTSRLSYEVREKRGLTYGVDSQFMPMPGDGPFLISLSTQNKEATNALEVTKDTLAKFLDNGPSEEELLAAKQYLVGSFPLSLSSNSSIAGMLLRMAFYHLPDDYLDTYTANISAVSVADIKKAFQAQIHPDKMLQVSVGASQLKTS